MCIRRHFVSRNCDHVPPRIEPCSRPTLCSVPTTNQFLSHPGECPDCLDNYQWPLRHYRTHVVNRQHPEAHQDSKDIIGYSQSLVDFIVIWMTDYYDDWDVHHQGMGLSGYTLSEHHKSILQQYHRESACHHCDQKSRTFGQQCMGCVVTSNATRQLRRQLAQHLYDTRYRVDINNGFFRTELKEIEPSFAQPRNPYPRLVTHTWPSPRHVVLSRHDVGMQAVADLIDEISSARSAALADPSQKDEERQHLDASALILQAASWLMAYDEGVGEEVIQAVLRYLAKILERPYHHHSRPPSWTEKSEKLDFSQYFWVFGAYALYLKHPVDYLASMVDELEWELRCIRSKQQESMNMRGADLMVSRLVCHSTLAVAGEMSPGWLCAVCHEGMDGQVVRLGNCGHCFHFDCMSGCLCQREHGHTECPLCRRTLDNMDPNNWRMVPFEEEDDRGIEGDW